MITKIKTEDGTPRIAIILDKEFIIYELFALKSGLDFQLDKIDHGHFKPLRKLIKAINIEPDFDAIVAAAETSFKNQPTQVLTPQQ